MPLKCGVLVAGVADGSQGQGSRDLWHVLPQELHCGDRAQSH